MTGSAIRLPGVAVSADETAASTFSFASRSAGSIVSRRLPARIVTGREKAASIRARAGSALRRATLRPATSTPGAIAGMRSEAGAAAAARPAAASDRCERPQHGLRFKQFRAEFCPTSSVPSWAHALRKLAARTLCSWCGASACGRPRGHRADCVRPRPARLRRPCRGARLSRRSAAGARSLRARRHARRGRGDRRRRRSRCAHLRPRRLRRGRDLRDRARGSAPARAGRGRRMASAVAVRRGLRPQRRHADAACWRRVRLRAHRRLRHHGRRRGRARTCARAPGGRHRSPSSRRRVPGVPGRRTAEGRLSVCRALRHGRRVEARAGAARRGASVSRPAPRRRRARDGRRCRPARRREPRARPSRATPACADAEARAACVDARRSRRPCGGRRVLDRVSPRTAHQCVGAAVPAGGRARAAPDGGRGRGDEARVRARSAERRASGGRAAHPP